MGSDSVEPALGTSAELPVRGPVDVETNTRDPSGVNLSRFALQTLAFSVSTPFFSAASRPENHANLRIGGRLILTRIRNPNKTLLAQACAELHHTRSVRPASGLVQTPKPYMCL